MFKIKNMSHFWYASNDMYCVYILRFISSNNIQTVKHRSFDHSLQSGKWISQFPLVSLQLNYIFLVIYRAKQRSFSIKPTRQLAGTRWMDACLCCWHALEPLEGRPLQALPMIRMSDPNECVGTLAKRFPKQVRDAVLGDHVVDMRSGGDHAAALPDGRHNFRLVALGHGRQCDDRLALAIESFGGTANEIHLTAKSRVPADFWC